MKKFNLRKNSDPQTYGIGLKEIWEVPKEKHQKGLVLHTLGWPVDSKTWGGSFMYHFGYAWPVFSRFLSLPLIFTIF